MNKKRYIKIIAASCTFFTLVIALAIIICYGTDNGVDKNTEIMMEYLGYTDCRLIKLGSCEKINWSEPKVTEEEVEEYVKDELEMYATKNTVVDRNCVQEGDYIIVSYEIAYNGTIVSIAEGNVVHVGSGNYDTQFEQEIVGAQIGICHEFSWTVPDNPEIYGNHEELAGQDVNISAYVDEIYSIDIPELTDEFAYEYLGAVTADEYLIQVYEYLDLQKRMEETAAIKETLIAEIIETSEFQIAEDILLNNAAEIYLEYEYNAYLLNMDFNMYAEEYLQTDIDNIYDKAYEDSVYEIGRYLVIGGIIKKENLSITEEEIKNFLSACGEEPDKLSEEDMCYISYYLLEEKALNTVYELY